MEVAWCRGEVLEVSMQVAQCRAQGSVTAVVAHDGGWRGGVEVRRRDVFGV